MIKVVLVDDHVIVRSGFSQLLSLEDDIQVIGEFSSAQEARQKLPGLGADVCILDISMPDESGLSLLKDIPSSIGCIMLSVHDSANVMQKALKAGARSYLSKRCTPEQLVQAVRTTAEGGSDLIHEIAVKIASPTHNPLHDLTRREQQVCELLAKGLDVKSIAEQLGLSHKTVHVHRSNAMSKLNTTNNVELAKYFTEDID